MRTVYRASDDDNACPVCSTPLFVTATEVEVAENMAEVSPLIPENEELRMAAVGRYEILDSPPDGAFDRITNLAARIFNVPIATITIVDTDRIWFKSKHGIDAVEIGRDPGLCASAVIEYEPWVVNDASKDPRTLENPLVRGELGLRFYAGAPLTTADGYNLGTLNIIDKEPRELTDNELQTLKELAEVVVDELELRLAALRLARKAAEKGLTLSA
jgi:GAF domain-containing protein